MTAGALISADMPAADMPYLANFPQFMAPEASR